jgi:hypothetical protein
MRIFDRTTHGEQQLRREDAAARLNGELRRCGVVDAAFPNDAPGPRRAGRRAEGRPGRRLRVDAAVVNEDRFRLDEVDGDEGRPGEQRGLGRGWGRAWRAHLSTSTPLRPVPSGTPGSLWRRGRRRGHASRSGSRAGGRAGRRQRVSRATGGGAPIATAAATRRALRKAGSQTCVGHRHSARPLRRRAGSPSATSAGRPSCLRSLVRRSDPGVASPRHWLGDERGPAPWPRFAVRRDPSPT